MSLQVRGIPVCALCFRVHIGKHINQTKSDNKCELQASSFEADYGYTYRHPDEDQGPVHKAPSLPEKNGANLPTLQHPAL